MAGKGSSHWWVQARKAFEQILEEKLQPSVSPARVECLSVQSCGPQIEQLKVRAPGC